MLLLVMSTALTAATATAWDAGFDDSPLPALLSIDWRRLPDLPQQGPLHQGFQDSDGGVIAGDTLITAFGSVTVWLSGSTQCMVALDEQPKPPSSTTTNLHTTSNHLLDDSDCTQQRCVRCVVGHLASM